ncbi:prolipoprotein diacylglyceryl transferase [Litorilinea aerophila]|uniref:Phosphatidylglycerol--prolipoprotein diacylglyceryl transferase n=1 Tax=Litorilinea aerophila TaxID=1204385 RepID=A0A540VB96_9CHLR|nr:prolipoprotein diacylglyceryl transferase [Litorilinea aerophila]MCC9078077.1 prolipoprotein diacylglyceryl transferase [Litorilinea aerophila]GIV77933.1 MAG: prolipoprotein diacylglyceryl transferase [Litorilinea sp.]
MNPVIFQFGPFALHWYGVFIVGGAVIAAWVSSRYAAKAGENPDHIWNLLAWSLIVGIIGARLYHVFSSPADGLGWAYYREHPLDIINFWNGGFRGLGIYGGLAGGTLAVAVYCWYHKLNPLRWLDFIAPNVLLAQAIGRMGNFVNQELYGPPTNVPWAFHINPKYPCQLPPNLPPDVQFCGAPDLTQRTLEWYASNGFHPTFFYEAGWNLLMFGVLTFIIRRYGHRLRTGDGLLLYLIAYPLGRFWVEMFRPDAWVIGNLATAQWIAIASVLGSAFILYLRHRNWSWQEHPEESLAAMSAAGQVATSSS